jgi:phosphoesterase RecJ-like protein
MKKLIDIAAAVERLRGAETIWILTHGHPDGDCLGSAFALAHALHALGKQAAVLCEDAIPAMYSYMQAGMGDCLYAGLRYDASRLPALPEGALLAAVDVAAEELLGTTLYAKFCGAVQLSIDHHATNALYAKETLLDSSAAAAAELSSDLIDALGVIMTPLIAACLYAGISTDTGCFRYSNTSARSHRYAARYMELGVETEPLDRAFFETKTRTYLALERLAFDNLRYYCGGRVALIAVTQEMYRQSGSNEEEYIKLVARTRQIEGVRVAVSIRERLEGDYKISLRSYAPINSAAICARMGGGGHSNAAGCSSKLPLEETIAAIVALVREALGQQEAPA